MVFALFADGPAVLAVVALCPPAIEDTTVRLTIERRLLTAGATGLVWTDRIIEPEVRTRDQVAGHIDVIVFQEDDLAAESIAT